MDPPFTIMSMIFKRRLPLSPSIFSKDGERRGEVPWGGLIHHLAAWLHRSSHCRAQSTRSQIQFTWKTGNDCNSAILTLTQERPTKKVFFKVFLPRSSVLPQSTPSWPRRAGCLEQKPQGYLMGIFSPRTRQVFCFAHTPRVITAPVLHPPLSFTHTHARLFCPHVLRSQQLSGFSCLEMSGSPAGWVL